MAGGLEALTDDQLDEVYAQGFNGAQIMKGDFIKGTTENGKNFHSFNVGDHTVYFEVGGFPNGGGIQVNMNGSLLLTDNAQQNAFIPINAVDSAVNIPINIVVIMGDNNGTIDISNILQSINKSNFVYPQ
ncbi:hypothetical protein [Persephonella sp.]